MDAGGHGCTELRLECGHVQRRRLGLCPPSRVICEQCAHEHRPPPTDLNDEKESCNAA